MLPHTLFDTLEHTFLLKPLLIAGKAMEYYGLCQGDDYDFVVPAPEFERLCQSVPEGQFTNAREEKGVRLGPSEFFVTQFGYGYYELEREAIEEGDYLVLHLEFLLFLKTLTLIHEPVNQKARWDIHLLMDKLGVLSLVPHGQREVKEMPEDTSPLDGRFEDVTEITVTELPSSIGRILTEHRCIIFERARETIQITFPEKTQRQLIWPRTIVDRYRIVFSDGLELRHEIDRRQERSLLDVVLQQ